MSVEFRDLCYVISIWLSVEYMQLTARQGVVSGILARVVEYRARIVSDSRKLVGLAVGAQVHGQSRFY